MKAIIKIQHVRRPTSQELIAYRLVAAIPNLEANRMKALAGRDGRAESFYATDEKVPSFRKPYFIAQSSDYSMIGRKELEKFIQDLMWEGFQEWEFFGNWDIQPIT